VGGIGSSRCDVGLFDNKYLWRMLGRSLTVRICEKDEIVFVFLSTQLAIWIVVVRWDILVKFSFKR